MSVSEIGNEFKEYGKKFQRDSKRGQIYGQYGGYILYTIMSVENY